MVFITNSVLYMTLCFVIPVRYKIKKWVKLFLNVRLAGDWKWLSTWLSGVVYLVFSCFMLSFVPRDVFDEICDRIESVPKDVSYLLF